MHGGPVASRRLVRGLCLLCCVAAPAAADPDPGAEPDAAELERVFKQRHRADRALVTLVVNGVEVASDAPVLLELAGATTPLAPAAPVIAALEPRLGADAKVRLLAAVRDHNLSVDALRGIGLAAVYDPRRLELRIDVPPALSATTSHDLGAGGPPDARGALAPSAVSGHVNLFVGGAGTRVSQDGSTTGQVHASSDAAINVLGWVLEGRGNLATRSAIDEPLVIRRGDILLTRDAPRYAMRFVAGDFAVPAAGPQASYPILGIGGGRHFALQPYKVLRPIGNFGFVLERPSAVTVLVNGAVVQTLRLPAGRHDLRDLPLGAAVNDIELVIKDDAGVERRIGFAAPSPDSLLAPGLTQFSLHAGFPLLSDAGLRTYDHARPIASGRFRVGVTSMLTLGVSLDGDRDRQVGGGALAIATRLGSLSIDTARSREPTGDGFAAGARYDYSRTSKTSSTALAVVAHHYSPGFRGLGPHSAGGRYSSDASITLTRRMSPLLIGRLEARYQVGRDLPDVRYSALGASRAFGRLAIDASISALQDPQTHNDVRLFVTAQWRLPGGRSVVHAASRASSTAGLSSEATLRRRPASPSSGLATSLRLSESQNQFGAGGTASYAGYRFTTSLAAGTTYNRGGSDVQTASLEAATALAFAGGRFAWSRPISGSFALVERHPAIEDVRIGINPALGGHATAADAFGSAVLPNLEAYHVNRLQLDAPDLPIGSSLGPTSYALLPTYRSGTLLRVGEEGTVSVRGIILHYNGESLALAVAWVLSIDQPRRPPVLLMTNRAGRFSLSGLRPGRYAVRLAGESVSSAEFEIPAGTVGAYSTGIVEVK